MGYTVKWVTENLGVTRDMLRYYEKKELLTTARNRNSTTNYREYSDKDIERIWGIKLLIGIGFSAEEINSFMKNPDFEFSTAIAKKVVELERKHDENVLYLEFAKTIKFTGRIPTTAKVGNVRFDDFLAYARQNWNFYHDPKIAPFMKLSDKLIENNPQDTSPDTANQLLALLENIDTEEMMNLYTFHGYFQVISDMQELGYDSDAVQNVVRLLHKRLVTYITDSEHNEKITPQDIAKHTAPFFLSGDIAILHERNYGKAGCLFIAQALAYYGGYDVNNL